MFLTDPYSLEPNSVKEKPERSVPESLPAEIKNLFDKKDCIGLFLVDTNAKEEDMQSL